MAIRPRAQSADGLGAIELLAEQVGAQRRARVLRQGVLGSVLMNSATGMLNPTASKFAVATTIRMSRAALPPLAGPVDVPAAVHPHVRAQHEPAGEVHQQVLAARGTRLDRHGRSAACRRARASAPGTPTRSGRRAGRRARGAACAPRGRWCLLQALSSPLSLSLETITKIAKLRRPRRLLQDSSPSYAPRPKPPWRIWKPIADG